MSVASRCSTECSLQWSMRSVASSLALDVPTARLVTFTVEDPAGSGPAAAIVQGLSFVDAATVVVLAADLPFAATAVPKLIGAVAGGDADAAMLVDDSDDDSRCSLLTVRMHLAPPRRRSRLDGRLGARPYRRFDRARGRSSRQRGA